MAKLKKSVWEIRFEAMQQKLRWKRESIIYNVSNKALSGVLSDDERRLAKKEIELYDNILKDFSSIRNENAKFIYLETDYLY